MGINKWQAKYVAAGVALLPFAPFLYVQSQIVRWKVGLLPDAALPEGVSGEGENESKLLVIGESTVAGLGAETHEKALAGQFARGISEKTGRQVRWVAVGRNGVTARRTIDELLPLVPKDRYEYILLGLGGNDVMKLSSPKKWRHDMLELLGIVRDRNPDAVIFISNCPMIKYSPIMPEPIKGILWRLSVMHDANIREFTASLDRVHYYPQPADVRLEGFFADGIHPSEQGYADWADAMIRHFSQHHTW